jgi:hypothetical protein
MWIGIIAGWVGGTVALYALLIRSSKEPKRGECMDCRLMDCAECPQAANAGKVFKRAA